MYLPKRVQVFWSVRYRYVMPKRVTTDSELPGVGTCRVKQSSFSAIHCSIAICWTSVSFVSAQFSTKLGIIPPQFNYNALIRIDKHFSQICLCVCLLRLELFNHFQKLVMEFKGKSWLHLGEAWLLWSLGQNQGQTCISLNFRLYMLVFH